MKTAPLCPFPSSTARGADTVERAPREAFAAIAKLYTPKGADEIPAASASRFALQVLDAAGKPYNADELVALVKTLNFAGEPVSAVKATAVLGTAEDNNGITLTMKTAGAAGNDYLLVVVVAGVSTPLSVALAGTTITINLETDVSEAAVSTAAEVIVALNAALPTLLEASDTGASTGAGLSVADETGFATGVTGTPAFLGRIATDETDVWTGIKDDPTGTVLGAWLKTFTATP